MTPSNCMFCKVIAGEVPCDKIFETDKFLAFRDIVPKAPTHVLVVDIPREESLKRISGRLTCSKCGAIYAMRDGYEIGDACECGGELMQRDDETPEAVSRRLSIYEESTKPIIGRYKEQGVVYLIDGMGSIEEIQDRIRTLIN